MKDKGYTNAFALLGGTPAWKQAGYPMEGEADNPKKPEPSNKK